MGYATLEEVKQWLSIDNSDTSKDLILPIYIDGISDLLDGMIGRDIFANDYTEKYQGTNSNSLVLRNYPINSVTAVRYILDGEVLEELTEDDYEINKKSGILYKDSPWLMTGYSNLMSGRINFPRRHISITYNAGYTETPPDLKLICLQLIQSQYGFDTSNGNTKGLDSYSISDVKMDWKDEIKLSETQIKTINKYKGVRF